MIAAIAAWLIEAKVSKRLAKPIAWAIVLVALALLAWGAWSLWIARHDKAVVAADRSEGTAAVLSNIIEAERQAGAAKDARDRAFANEQDQLEEKVDGAADNGISPLDALFDELR